MKFGVRGFWTGATRAGVLVLAALAAVGMGRLALQLNTDRACEGNEWPYLASCAKREVSVSAQVQELRVRAGRSPGDATSYLALALLTTQPGGIAPLSDDAVLDVAAKLAPQDPVLRTVLASRALQRGQYAQAVHWLARQVEDGRDPAAASTLASLVAVPDGRAALMAALTPESRWVEQVLGALPGVHVPALLAMPLVDAALSLRLIAPEIGLGFVSQLKSSGYWFDAQALWLRLLGQPAPLIYNGGFEQGFIRGGFDWELSDSSPGVRVQQPAIAGANGRAIELAFTGRPLAVPVIGQYLVLFPGDYVFSGRFMARRLRAGSGLAWLFSCARNGSELGRSQALTDTQGNWQDFSLNLAVPAGCGAVVLHLRTQLASDALAGVHGDAYFDDFRLSAR